MTNLATTATWFDIAIAEIGVKEMRGAKHNERILEYLRATDLGSELTDEIAWCSAFASWCMQQAGYRGTRKANARSWLQYGAPCDLQRGAIVVFERGEPWQGHVGMVWAVNDHTIEVLGGNQSNEVCVKPYPRARLLAVRWPTDADLLPTEFR